MSIEFRERCAQALSQTSYELQYYLTGRWGATSTRAPSFRATLSLEIVDPIHIQAMLALDDLPSLIRTIDEPVMLRLVIPGFRVKRHTFAHPDYPLIVPLPRGSVHGAFSISPYQPKKFHWDKFPVLTEERASQVQRMGVTDFKLGHDFLPEPPYNEHFLCYNDHEQWMLAKMAFEGR